MSAKIDHLADNPLCASVLDAIAEAKTEHGLKFIELSGIPHVVGILDEERLALLAAVNQRRVELDFPSTKSWTNGCSIPTRT